MAKQQSRPRGRPTASPLTRAEQLRAAKRAQRRRERRAGLATVQLRLPAEQAERLRVAVNAPGFNQALDDFLQGVVIDRSYWPTLRELTWNRVDRWIPAAEALALYERNWRFVDPAELDPEEAAFLRTLRERHGSGVMHV